MRKNILLNPRKVFYECRDMDVALNGFHFAKKIMYATFAKAKVGLKNDTDVVF